MNGAEALVRTLLHSGVNTCFANPGTSEMHLVAALDRVEGMKSVLCLFEGVVTGAADGYARMTGDPAACLLHLGPGLANGLANMHNARKANTPLVNIVGEHATHHRRYDAPLTADIAGFAAPASDWVRLTESTSKLGEDVAAAVGAARGSVRGAVATLIVPADVAWTEGATVAPPTAAMRPAKPDAEVVREAVRLLRLDGAALMIGGSAMYGDALWAAARIAAATGARLIGPANVGRAERGAGNPFVERIPYPVAQAVRQLSGLKHVVMCGAPQPVAFFAYPGQPSELLPRDAHRLVACAPDQDPVAVLSALEAELGAAKIKPPLQRRSAPSSASGPLTVEGVGAVLATLLPDNSVLVEESITSSFVLLPLLSGAARHDHLQLTGGSIGIGLPLATGAAIGAPDRKVITLEADGSAMYTLQALWTQARENCDVLTIILANRAYATLRVELANVGVNAPGAIAQSMLELDRPKLDWVALANGLGVEAAQATTAERFRDLISVGLSRRGPFVIEAVLP